MTFWEQNKTEHLFIMSENIFLLCLKICIHYKQRVDSKFDLLCANTCKDFILYIDKLSFRGVVLFLETIIHYDSV